MGIPLTNVDQSPVTKSLLEAGLEWEETVITQKVTGNVKIPPGNERISDRSFSIEESLSLLPQLELNETIYQPMVPITQTFFEKYGLDQNNYHFSPCRPDLIRLHTDENGDAALQVIDVKASDELSMSHRIQATLYSLIITETFREKGICTPVDLDHAGIWLYGQDAPEIFDQHLTIQFLDNFFRYQLPEIMGARLEDVFWHLRPQCELCDFYPYCREMAEKSESVSLIPFLSVEGKRHIAEQQNPDGEVVSSLSDLSKFLSLECAENILDRCGSLRNRKDNLQSAISALKCENIVLHGGLSSSFPVSENVGIVLTLQNEPVSGQIYAAAFKRFKGKSVFGSGVNEAIYIAKSPENCDEVRRDFVRSLYKELERLNCYNKDVNSWEEQQSLQTYVYDSYELDLFNQLLKESLLDPEVREPALQLLFYYQNPGLNEEPIHPRSMTEYPVIVLTQEIKKLAALPVPFSLRLPEVQKVLGDSAYGTPINPTGLFWFEQSNRLKSEAIAMAWSGKRPEAIEWIQWELSRRLSAGGNVLDGLRNKTAHLLFRWPPKFQFPHPGKYRHPEISRLIFITRYESFMGAQKTQELRTKPWDVRVSEGISIPLEYVQDNMWRLKKPLEITKFGRYESFSYLIVPKGADGDRAQMKFNDFKYQSSFDNPGNSNVSFAYIKNKYPDSAAGLMKGFLLDIKYGREQKIFEPGDSAVIHPRCTDFTSGKVIKHLEQLDRKIDDDFIRLLKNPRHFLVPPRDKGGEIKTALEISSGVGFTKSQKQAFDHMVNNRLTLVWGPPGTGKTHFLAKAILSLVQARKECGLPCRIGVAGFTHASIENLLIKIHEFAEEFDCSSDLSIFKVKSIGTSKGKRILEVLDRENIGCFSEGTFAIFGGTVYGLNWLTQYLLPFDILVVDEASQMKPGELALGMKMLGEGGRLVLAGDNLQLSPIIMADYSTPDDDTPGLDDSIFAYLRGCDDPANPAFTCQLQENWRMNMTLSSFAADTLYGNAYRPATEEIHNQKLALLKNTVQGEGIGEVDEFLEWVLSPDYPLTLCIIENVKAALANESEAELVAKLAGKLRVRMQEQNLSRVYPESEEGDYQFWREGLFIVSPHHLQIEAIQNHLGNQRNWRFHPFVDTVDKMQGQEANAVIVSYGVSDVETAINEAEFIYSLNRLNVSVTRARSKCIVFIPRPLLEPPIELLQNRKAAEGLSYMLGLQRFCREYGNIRRFDIHPGGEDNPVQVTVLRAKVGSGFRIDDCSEISI